MVIRLGQGYWVDATDGLNWTLYQDRPELQRPEMLGYHSNLRNALRAATEKGVQDVNVDAAPDLLEGIVRDVAQAILGEANIRTVRKDKFGIVKRFKFKNPQSRTEAELTVG